MRALRPPRIRLEPMSERDFRDSLERSVSRLAEEYVRRGYWVERAALEASRKQFAQLLPNGRETPDRHFANVIRPEGDQRVGETWYQVQEQGGKPRFWVDWLWIDPAYRRQGYATVTLLRLEAEAREQGADRVGLAVWFDNPGAIALYTKLGYVPANMWMTKPLRRGP